MFWLALAVIVGMAASGFVQGFSRSLIRLQLLVLALVITGALLSPMVTFSQRFFEWPLYFHQLLVGGVAFSIFYTGSCAIVSKLFDRDKVKVERRVGWASRAVGSMLGALAGAVIAAVLAFLIGVQPDFDKLRQPSKLLNQVHSYSPYAVGEDAFDSPSESPASQLLSAIILSPLKGVKALQQASLTAELSKLLDIPAVKSQFAAGDLYGLVATAEFERFVATEPVQVLWALQRELEALTDSQLKEDTAAQLLDAYRRVSAASNHPRVVQMLTDPTFKLYLQTAELNVLAADTRVRELGAALMETL